MCFVCVSPRPCGMQADAPVARNSLQAISVMATHHVTDRMKGGEGLSAHLAAKPDLFVGVLRTLLHVSENKGVGWRVAWVESRFVRIFVFSVVSKKKSGRI